MKTAVRLLPVPLTALKVPPDTSTSPVFPSQAKLALGSSENVNVMVAVSPTFSEAAVALNPKKHKRGEHQEDQNELEQSCMGTDEIKHDSLLGTPGCENDKGEPGFACGRVLVGADGIEPPTYAL